MNLSLAWTVAKFLGPRRTLRLATPLVRARFRRLRRRIAGQSVSPGLVVFGAAAFAVGALLLASPGVRARLQRVIG